jgi:hypothetical protein
MSFLTPQAQAFLTRWREAAAAGVLGLIGIRLVWQGGYFLGPLGTAVLVLALGWLTLALRRMQFQRAGDAPGLVEIDEGQIGYLGPTFGGYVSVRELVEIRLVDIYERRHWRLKQADGQALLIPVSAQNAEVLFDAFSALPGVDLAAITSALAKRVDMQVVWRKPAHMSLHARP